MAHPFMHLAGFSDYDAEQLIYAAPNANTKFMDEFAQDGVVAEASGTQALATQLIAQTNRVVTVAGSGYGVKLPESKPGRERMNNRITTVAVAGDGVKFPVGAQGANMIVTNASANAMNLWPGLGDSINALAANTALSIPAGKTATAFVATLAAPFVWHVVIGA